MSQRTCTFDGCSNKHWARGMCRTHYNRECYTPEQRHPKVEVACTQCGKILKKHPSKRYRPFCDYTCRDLYSIEHGLGAWGQEKKPKTPPADRRGPLRRALEDGDPAAVMAAIKRDCDVRPSGCWEWTRKLHASGYAVVTIAGRMRQVHRLALEAKLGQPLGKQAAHHTCANSFCVNPDHLQPVTHIENAAEMLARRYMEQRIRDLEEALAALDPSHALLGEVGIPTHI